MRRTRYLARRLLAIYQKANAAAKAAGRDWYRRARVIAYHMARDARVSLSTAAGVIAALSPRLQWTHNVNAAHRVLLGLPVTGVFRASLSKARRILAGERPLDVLSGPKVRAFFMALTGDESAAVVDVWVARAAGLKSASLKPRQYGQVADALTLAAQHAQVPVAQLQASVWVAVRGRA